MINQLIQPTNGNKTQLTAGGRAAVRADAVAAINNLALQLGQTMDFYQQKAQATTR